MHCEVQKCQFLSIFDKMLIISPEAVWEYIGFGLVWVVAAASYLPLQTTYAHNNSKSKAHNFMKLCKSLDMSM